MAEGTRGTSIKLLLKTASVILVGLILGGICGDYHQRSTLRRIHSLHRLRGPVEIHPGWDLLEIGLDSFETSQPFLPNLDAFQKKRNFYLLWRKCEHEKNRIRILLSKNLYFLRRDTVPGVSLL